MIFSTSHMPGLVILTGAGISAESGLATFRGSDGLWEGHRVEEVASPEGFAANPALVQQFYNLRRAALETVQPNAAHHALVRLEQQWPGPFLLVTQNVDDLHERAGSRKLRHLHGELRRARCLACGVSFSWSGDISPHSACSACGLAGRLRPDIVWFGEMPFYLEEIFDVLDHCGIFLSIGTSGLVYPAAGFVRAASLAGAHTIEANLDPTATSHAFAETRPGPATLIIPALVDEMLHKLNHSAG
jgi:NAD-dependent deacetylase